MTWDRTALFALLTTYGVRVLGVLVLLIVAWVAAGYTRTFLRKAFAKTRFDATLARFFSNAARWAILIFTAISALGIFGVQATSFAAVIAALGLAVGLAFQGTLSNFAAGVMLLVFRPFNVGDTVKVAGQTGTVDEIDLFTTSLDTADHRRIILPNSVIFGATIENVTHHRQRRVDVDVAIDAKFEPGQVRRALQSAVSGLDGASTELAPAVVLTNVAVDKNDWQVQVWGTSAQYGALREQVLLGVRAALAVLAGEAPTAASEDLPGADGAHLEVHPH